MCLRCRQEQRALARATQRRLILRSGIALAGLVVVAVISNSALSALRARRPSDVNQPVKLLASTSSSTVRQQGEAIAVPTPEAPAGTLMETSQQVTAATVAPMSGPAVNTPSSPVSTSTAKPSLGMTLRVPAGRTELRDSMFVERDADSAVVHFDTEAARTRRRDKFEATVRATLPRLYGAQAESVLAAIPDGTMTGGRDLVSDVTTSGVKLTIPTGGTLDLLPVTRPGRDGPLVVGYRVRVTP